MEIHHSKHHQAYINNLNKAINGTEWAKKTLEQIFLGINATTPAAVRNNAGGHYNHTLFWQMLSPTGGGEPVGKLAKNIIKTFGSTNEFKKQFADAAKNRFGSGWAWLILQNGKLIICSTPNQDNPLMSVADHQGSIILGLDVWEHAYYLQYQNRRTDYITAFWNVINWHQAEKNYLAARKRS
jgi:Fe-Mn family superoxide dismutase